MKEPASGSAVGLGSAIRFVLSVETAEDIVVRRPLHVVADEKIEQSIAIVVEPESGGAETLALAETRSVRDIHERSLAGVAEESILSDAGDQDVGKAVVVVVAAGDS